MSRITVKLGDVCAIYTGTGFPVQYQGESSGDFPFYKVGDISKNVSNGHIYLVDCDNYISKEVAKKIKGTVVPPDTVVFAKIGEAVKLNRRAITSTNCLVDNNAMGICPDQSKLLLSYFYHYMCSIKLEKYAEATTVPSVKKSVVEKLEIPQISIEEQRTIADTLDAIDGLISLYKQQLSELNQLVKSRFIELFGDPVRNEKGWPMATLGDMADIRIGPFGTLLHKEDYVIGGHALVNPSHIIDGKICTDAKLTVSDQKYNELSAYHLAIGDIVLGRRGEMGRCAVVYDEGLLCGTGSMVIRPNNKMHPYFLQTILSSPTYKKTIEDKAVGVTMLNLNVPIVSSLSIPQLPIAMQEQFIEFMQHTDKLKFAVYNAVMLQLELLTSLKNHWKHRASATNKGVSL